MQFVHLNDEEAELPKEWGIVKQNDNTEMDTEWKRTITGKNFVSINMFIFLLHYRILLSIFSGRWFRVTSDGANQIPFNWYTAPRKIGTIVCSE